MRYSVLSRGKRLRPLLCVAVACEEGASLRVTLPAAVAVELLHTYSLVHDDLPAMDNDTLRRGKPTTHRVFGEAVAILAGDALLTLAFELLAGVKPKAPYRAADLVQRVAVAAGGRGVVGGQAEDIAGEGKTPTVQKLTYIHQHKTADLMAASLVVGAMMAGVGERKVKLYEALGQRLGLAFQLRDDVLNETSTAHELGKAAKSDQRHQKMTGVRLWGVAEAQERIKMLHKDCEDILAELQLHHSELPGLVRGIIVRGH